MRTLQRRQGGSLRWIGGAPSVVCTDPFEILLTQVRSGKGSKITACAGASRVARGSALAYGDISNGRIVEAWSTTAWRWVQAAVKRAEELGAISLGKRIGTHTLRHSYARHLLMNGIPINYLSRWLGHSSIQTTLIYLELVPDPSGSLAAVP